MNNNIVAFIPARSGSKRLKDKNIKKINNQPLIFWTVFKSLKSKIFKKVIFSSDSLEYFNLLLKILKKKNIDISKLIFDHRSKNDSSDNKKIFEYVKNSLPIKQKLTQKDLIALLLPTAPLRKIKTIKKVVDISLKTKKDVFTANSFEMSIKYAIIKKKKNWTPSYKKSPLLAGDTRSQDQQKYLRPNPVCCCLWVKNFNRNKRSIYNNSLLYETDKLESIDIDTKEDFLIADLLMRSLDENT
jgi:CMP-N,N'-diacetyllegionaminic acid synthase